MANEMDAALVRRCDDILQAGDNLLNSYVSGNPQAAVLFRHHYLNWFETVERLVGDVAPHEVPSLQTPRHRDIANGVAAADRIYSEVAGEVRNLTARLKVIREQLASRPQPEIEVSGRRGAFVEFAADSGKVYRYDSTEPLGSPGAYGVVFKGFDDAGTAYAIKVVMFRRTTSQALLDDRRLSEREALIAARDLGQRPGSHLVPVIDIAHRDDDLILVMPLAKRDLGAALDSDGPMTERQVVDLIRAMATALQELAEAGIIHRDIKPTNILELDGRWCLADFGISRIVDAATATLTWAGTGTLEYRAPELFRDQPARVSTDLYAVGCVALEALTGRKAFRGPDFRNDHLMTVPSVPEEAGPLLRRVILDLLSKNPGSRPSDARQLLEMMESRDSLTAAQTALQRVRAAQRHRQAELDATYSSHLVLEERLHEGSAAFRRLWRETVESAQRAVIDAAATEDDREFVLSVGDAHLRVEIFATVVGADVLAVAEVIVARGSGGAREMLANLICEWSPTGALWSLVRFPRIVESTFRTEQVGEPVGQFPTVWNSGDKAAHSTYELATADGLLSVFAEGFEVRSTGDESTESYSMADEQP